MKKQHLKNIFFISMPIIFIVLFFTRFYYTFGSNTDWICQHTIIPDYFRQMFYATGKLLPNLALNYGGGQNIFNLSYYGLLSPVILPSYLMPFMSMTLYMTIVDIMIVIFSGSLFYEWLIKNKYDIKLSLISSIIFILSEGLLFHMHRHIMFVNYMPFLIMSLMGVDKLLLYNKKSYLVISIFLMIMTSYYYSVTGIIVVGIYFIYKYLSLNKKFDIKKFSLSLSKLIGLVFVSVMLASIILLPTIYVLFSGRGESSNQINLISLFIPSLKYTKVFSGTYSIGFSMLGFISLLYLFYTKKRNNIVVGILSSIVLFLPIFCFVLNGGLYLREKCFMPFMPLIGLFIVIFLKDLLSSSINIKKFISYILIITIPLYFFNQMSESYLYLIFIILLMAYFDKTKDVKNTTYALVIVVFLITLITNLIENYVSIKDYKKYFSDSINNEIKEVINSDNSFYRTNNLTYLNKTVNKIYDFRYYTPNMYSSTYNKYYLSFIRNIFKLNDPDFNYFFVSASNNLLFNTFMGVKYLYSTYDVGLGYNNIKNNIYKSNQVFPIMYLNNHIMNESEFDKLEYPYNLESLLNNVIVNKKSINSINVNNINKTNLDYSIKSYGKNITIEKYDNMYKINVKENDKMIIHLNKSLKNKILFINLYGLNRNSCKNGNTYIKINNVKNLLTCTSWIYHNQNEDFHYAISDHLIEDLTIEFGKGTYEIKGVDTYVLDYDYIKNINHNNREISNINIELDKISCLVNNLEDNYFVTSIPYDKGFKVKVNNQEVETEIVNKAFLGFYLKSGYNKVEISYKSPLLKEGKIISCIGFIILISLVFIDKKKTKKL